MAEITSFTEISIEDIPLVLQEGTKKRRQKLYLRFSSAATGDTIDLTAEVDKHIADVENLVGNIGNGITSGTVITWSGTGLTMIPDGALTVEAMATVTMI